MILFDSNYFTYQSNELYCESTQIKKIIEETKTPVYIYSKKFFTDRVEELNEAFSEIKHKIFFSAKSNYNINTIKIFHNLGCGIDVNSEGEIFRATKAGVEGKDMIFSGVGKTKEDIEAALKIGIHMIKVESFQELELINEIASQKNLVANIAIRVNPDVDPQTHPYISTGLAKNKFGISSSQVLEIFQKGKEMKNINFVGIDMHLGSQIKNSGPFVDGVEKLVELVNKLKNQFGISLSHLDIGGGIGVSYEPSEPHLNAKTIISDLVPIFKKVDCEIYIEPGRFLTANGGILATQVLFTKKNDMQKNFVIVDAAMTDLIRPSLYKSYHHIQPVDLYESETYVADIVGPVCESGDFLALQREISKCKSGDYLAVFSSGAYGMVMSSNYNGRRRPPEVFVDGNQFFIGRSRESFDYLIFDEKIQEKLHQKK
ncbi:diaminopimelate decarboxylase 1 -related [Anaeramoeba ignava]|uniref:Diaminopimelate decarboxylase 1 -related n=1 Tax=Anaeramoeba ignava TaxID=1746090 RepID=A0A9Q0LQH0_ANAIG|nr:diaminopimelate decarboxylase 1 -related [Anaeramoeba ignava]